MVKFGERIDRRTLSINERVLLHIHERSTTRGALEAPFPLTQQGIARALRMRVNHVSRAVKALQAQNCVTEGAARVRGEVRKRKVYLISHEGHATAQALVTDLGHRLLLVKDDRGVTREMTLAEARKLPGGPYTFTDLLSNLDASGATDVARLSPGRAAVSMSHVDEGRPRGEPFFGRTRELASVLDWVGGPAAALVVLGPRGVGKTALASKAMEGLASERHTFWHTFRDGEGTDGIVRGLATFLNSVGRGDLSSRLLDGPVRLQEVETLLERDWPAENAVLVLDDADRGPAEVVQLLLSTVRSRGGKAILTAERPPAEHARLRASGDLQVLALGGLEKAECRKLAPKGMPQDEFEKVYRLSGGNPLSMRLLAADVLEGIDAKFNAEERALLRVLKLRQESD